MFRYNDINTASTHPGSILIYSGTSSPNGWLLCDGSSYNSNDYPNLYNIIGTRYGGSGQTFNVPNLINMFVFGPLNTSLLNNSINGSNSVTLTTNNLPSHYHNYQDVAITSGTGGSLLGAGNTDNDNEFYYRTNTNTSSGNSSDSSTFLNTSSVGSGTSFSTIPTHVQMNFIIKY